MNMEKFIERWTRSDVREHTEVFIADVRRLADLYYQQGRSDEHEEFYPYES